MKTLYEITHTYKGSTHTNVMHEKDVNKYLESLKAEHMQTFINAAPDEVKKINRVKSEIQRYFFKGFYKKPHYPDYEIEKMHEKTGPVEPLKVSIRKL